MKYVDHRGKPCTNPREVMDRINERNVEAFVRPYTEARARAGRRLARYLRWSGPHTWVHARMRRLRQWAVHFGNSRRYFRRIRRDELLTLAGRVDQHDTNYSKCGHCGVQMRFHPPGSEIKTLPGYCQAAMDRGIR